MFVYQMFELQVRIKPTTIMATPISYVRKFIEKSESAKDTKQWKRWSFCKLERDDNVLKEIKKPGMDIIYRVYL